MARAKTVKIELTQAECEVAMIVLSNYTFTGTRPNPRAQVRAYYKIRKARNGGGFGPWRLRRT